MGTVRIEEHSRSTRERRRFPGLCPVSMLAANGASKHPYIAECWCGRKIVVVVAFSQNRIKIELQHHPGTDIRGTTIRTRDSLAVLLSSFVPRYYVFSVEDE